ncbi:JAB domain-containing protein [Chryseolinea lacunae]|uniref:JAB domain-containing protein n=1 Tax=Chryseolinea lacunae TaxID=2801331 RepID=A0ABS1KP00_9BACT|nr:JAB domain-containing protein [Chryseolinea lacunae]MBL0741174.1 JAB domain-containing protein [Chryseolinea lacunae]
METSLTEAQKQKLINSRDVFAVMQPLLLRENAIRKSKGHFWVIGLNSVHHVLYIELVGMGSAVRLNIAPREVFRMALYKMAAKIIVVSSRNEGPLVISQEDKDVTTLLVKAGEVVNVEVADHLLITESEWLSLAAKNAISQAKRNTKYVLPDEHRSQLLDIQSGTETMLTLARKMKLRGYDVDHIKEMTGLRKIDINKL